MTDSFFQFSVEKRDRDARVGLFTTPHGPVHTPSFMPVGTHGSVKAMLPAQVRATGAEVVLANTYHLALRPGEALVEKLGGLHSFMCWDGPILTDSGGFQVFSIPQKEISDRGVRFLNEITGEAMELTPERSIEIQNTLGADIIMAFDECTPYPADKKLAATGVRRTLAWLERCLAAHRKRSTQALFGIVQGSVYRELREQCAREMLSFDLPGYAIGGVSVGEGHELLCEITGYTAPLLPENKPRYLMGVGLPEDLLAAVGMGIDLFDCVIPTRYARSATLFTRRGKIRLTNRRYRRDAYPIDTSCNCVACSGGFSRAYLHHLFAANEILSTMLASIHNTHFYQQLMHGAREAIRQGRFDEYRHEFLADYTQGADDGDGEAPKESARAKTFSPSKKPTSKFLAASHTKPAKPQARKNSRPQFNTKSKPRPRK